MNDQIFPEVDSKGRSKEPRSKLRGIDNLKSQFTGGDCPSEYAEVWRTVCVDAANHTVPSVKYLEGLVSRMSGDFQFGVYRSKWFLA